jgi:hypothetical protein
MVIAALKYNDAVIMTLILGRSFQGEDDHGRPARYAAGLLPVHPAGARALINHP